MTFKTTEDHINGVVRSGRLKLFDPSRLPHERYRRRLWLHPDIDKWVMTEGETGNEKRYHAEIRAFFKAFVLGADFNDDDLLKALKPECLGIFEFRITFHPQERIFGSFLRVGEFVATNRKDRTALASGFAPHLDRCSQIWTSIFPKHSPLQHDRSSLLGDFCNDHV